MRNALCRDPEEVRISVLSEFTATIQELHPLRLCVIYYVYILTNRRHTVYYTGVTNDLDQRVFEHKAKVNSSSFTARYNCEYLVYYEGFDCIEEAIKREKQLKKYPREWKDNLIRGMNPHWADLSEGWFNPKEFEIYKKFNK